MLFFWRSGRRTPLVVIPRAQLTAFRRHARGARRERQAARSSRHFPRMRIGSSPTVQSFEPNTGRSRLRRKIKVCLSCLGGRTPQCRDESWAHRPGDSKNPGLGSKVSYLPPGSAQKARHHSRLRFTVSTECASHPASRKYKTYSAGRFSSILNFKLLFPMAGLRFLREPVRPHRPALLRCLPP